ncbi:Activating signal cointegrator 1 complex subunit 2-like [Homarus americanus]|uniref:Activating signal cointegrator 1 complex subunit 2-like n=1 Tax=Homarus americanus TaxID=6706 RepID=A0A8J5MLN1_HOMAM|nr:Activating signal cointegrator 1 complex subunit 2-like [Homarus americanus]
MSTTGAIPKGGARPKCNVRRESDTFEKLKEDSEVIGEPLDKKFLTFREKGFDKRVPALHIAWAHRGTYIKYIPPPLPEEDGSFLPGAIESWLEQMEFLEQDLRNMLNLPHHKFWSQMVFDPAIHECLESYIANSYRWYEGIVPNDHCTPVVESVHQLMFLIYVRMSTYKESKACHITPSTFGDIIYENYLFDICKLLDLCILYGPTNSPLLAKMITNIFTQQPKYYDDLSQTVSSISLALEKVEDKLGVAEYCVPVAIGAPAENLSMADLQDIILYLLSSIYERVIPSLMDMLSERCDVSEWEPRTIQRIQLIRSSLLITFRAILHHKCLAPLSLEKPLPTLVGECVEKFMQVMSTCVGEKTFIADYCSAYPINTDLEFFKQHGGDITSLSFIKDAVNMVLSEMGLASGMVGLALDELEHKRGIKNPDDTTGMNGYAQVGAAIPSSVELASLVSSIQDLLPDLGAGFIQECLKYYCYSTEDVIHALLEGNLPPSLITLDRSMPALVVREPTPPPPPPAEDDAQAKTVCQVDYMDRANVFNNDEFDVFSRSNVDCTKIQKGKKPKIKEIARQYDERGGTSIYEDEFRYEDESYRPWDYDDEYDDTYDDNEAGNIDDLGVEKLPKRRPGIIGAGRLNTQIDYGYAGESAEEDSDKEQEEGSNETGQDKEDSSQKSSKEASVRPKNRSSTRGVQRVFSTSSKPKQNTTTPERVSSDDVRKAYSSSPNADLKPSNGPSKTSFRSFCEDPEVVRQRAEQRRQDKIAYRNRGYRGGGGGDQGRREENLSNGIDGERYGSRPKVSQSSNKNSGKGWRQGQNREDDSRGYQGGKYKEDTNHGKAQSQQYRHKMTHKNENKRQGAQAKFNRNN